MKKNSPLLVGITGGIGSGKSTICKVFQALGIPNYEADSRARYLMNHDAKLKSEIIQHFGEDSYDNQGNLNRPYLASKVFNDEAKVKLINSIVHPRVGQDFINWVAENPKSPYLINEAALMFESGRYLHLDKVITVFTPEEIRIRRIQHRDKHRSLEEIKAIISKQMPEEEKIAKADYVIYNDEKQSVLEQVLRLHHTFTELSQQAD